MACSRKVAFTTTVVSVLMLILVPIHQIQGFPHGAPPQACGDMIPGHGVSAQQSTSPFMAIVSNMVAETGTPIMLELRPTDSRNNFKGYLVMAFDVNDNSQPIGTFKQPNTGKLIDCGNGRMNAATHSDSSTKTSVTLEWIPPPNYSGQVKFRTTFVQNKVTFWVKTESETVSYATTGQTKQRFRVLQAQAQEGMALHRLLVSLQTWLPSRY
uniref:Reelin domain-containing protein n=1 Tax=Daphnia galeata TaxID=27404 RepID=A0A8J2RPH9_9CRUS|nr:unnamed protein product [Daphnia galeata]